MKKIKLKIQSFYLSVLIGIVILIINILFIGSLVINVISIIVAVSGPTMAMYMKYLQNKEIEERFPDFLRDVAGNIRAGMTLPQAITATKETHYGALTPYVKRMIAQIDWGVPFDDILKDFSKRSTYLIKNMVSTIIETHRGGGNVPEIFDSVGRSAIEINKIKKERYSSIYNQMLIGYVIFFVFIGVIIILKVFLIPSLYAFMAPETGVAITEELSMFFSSVFQMLVLIQGFFSGLVIGKMSEGSIIAGLKHSLVLIATSYSILLFFI